MTALREDANTRQKDETERRRHEWVSGVRYTEAGTGWDPGTRSGGRSSPSLTEPSRTEGLITSWLLNISNRGFSGDMMPYQKKLVDMIAAYK